MEFTMFVMNYYIIACLFLIFSIEANCGETVLIKRSFGRGLELQNNADPVALEKSEGFEYWYVEGIETAFELRQDAFEMANTWASLQKKMQKQKTFLEGAWSKFTNNQHRLIWGTPVEKFQAYREFSKDLVAQFISDIQGHMTRARDLVDYAKKRDNPFAGIGGVVQEYTELLGDKVELAKSFKDNIEKSLSSRINDLDASFKGLAEQMWQSNLGTEKRTTSQPKRINPSAMTLESWQSQKIRDMGGFTGTQEIELCDDGTLLIKQVGDSDGALTVQRLASADILRETVEVQPTKSRDLWMVILRTNGRVITKQSQGIGGQAVTDKISRLVLFFSTPDAARAAAEALRKE
jgi:hypothetical protein